MKKTSIFSQVVMPLVVIGATVALFLLFKSEEPTALFWVNFAYTLLLEAGLFGWVGWMRREENETSSFLKIAMGTFGWFYMVAGVLVMLAFSLASIWCTVDIRWYVAIHIVLLCAWIIPAAWLAESDANYKEYRAQKKAEKEQNKGVEE